MPRTNNTDAAGDRTDVDSTTAEAVSYDPADVTKWDGRVDPGNVNDALDQIATHIGAGAAHTLLDGTVHLDTEIQDATEGSMIHGNAVKKWDEKVIGGNTKIVISDGTDFDWKDIDDFIADGAPDGAADHVMSYDDSAGIHKKVQLRKVAASGPPQVHNHDTNTLQLDGINSNGGPFSFITSGTVGFSEALKVQLNKKLLFGDVDVYIESDADGDLNMIADGDMNVLAGGTVTVAGTTDSIFGVLGNIEIGDGNLRTMKPQTNLKVNLGTVGSYFNDVCASQLRLLERASDPTEPIEGQAVIWMSDGTGKGDDGDVLIASKAGGVTKWTTLFDHDAGDAW